MWICSIISPIGRRSYIDCYTYYYYYYTLVKNCRCTPEYENGSVCRRQQQRKGKKKRRILFLLNLFFLNFFFNRQPSHLDRTGLVCFCSNSGRGSKVSRDGLASKGHQYLRLYGWNTVSASSRNGKCFIIPWRL